MNGEALSGKDVRCNYCGAPADLVTGKVIYPHRPDLHDKHFFQCSPCDARVGCHPGTKTALGRLANAELRRAKSAAHAAFDPIWRSRQGGMTRSQAYGWLADQLGIKHSDCHIGEFDVETCNRVVALCRTREAA